MEQIKKQALTKNKIDEAFFQLMEQCHFSSIRVTSIAKLCHISNQSFYRLYSNKYDLAVSLFSAQLTSSIHVCGNNCTFREVMIVILTIIKNNTRIYGNLLRDDEGSKLFPDILSKTSTDFNGFPPAWSTTIINSHLIIDWANDRFDTSVDEMYNKLVMCLPACEFLTKEELKERIEKYERIRLREFSEKR